MTAPARRTLAGAGNTLVTGGDAWWNGGVADGGGCLSVAVRLAVCAFRAEAAR